MEDTRPAVREARRRGLDPFGIALDTEAGAYLAHRLGSGGFTAIRRPCARPGSVHA